MVAGPERLNAPPTRLQDRWNDASGGLGYHWRAWRYRQHRWAPFHEAVAGWLEAWTPPARTLVLVGPSGGYALNARFLSRFEQHVVLEPDPLARLLLRRRFPGFAWRFERADVFHDPAALNRLGIEAVRDLASSYAIKTLFFLKEPLVKRRLADVWRRSVHTAALAHVMASRCGFNPDQALLAGLLQDIGALPILSELLAYPALLADSAIVEHLLTEFTGKVSGLILNHWQFPHDLVVTGLSREQWQRDKRGPADLADLILVARYHTYLGQPAAKKLPALSGLPAFSRLALGELGPEQGLLFLREAREEVEALRQILAS